MLKTGPKCDKLVVKKNKSDKIIIELSNNVAF